jgi:trans-aconitate methyltransferase
MRRVTVPAMDGYRNASYGDAFADVYDTWYEGISDVAATVATLAELAQLASSVSAPIVELGVGTGRIAIPLAERVHPTPVVGIDASEAMLAVMAAKPAPVKVTTIVGDMVDGLPDSPLTIVFVAYNTFFNLPTSARQQQCFDAVAARIAPGGCFVIEAFVPERPPRHGSHVEVRSLAADRVVLSVSVHDGDGQTAEGQFVEFTETGGVRLRPWSIRYADPDQLDAMAAAAGLRLRHRWSDFAKRRFDADSTHHVSVYERHSAP